MTMEHRAALQNLWKLFMVKYQSDFTHDIWNIPWDEMSCYLRQDATYIQESLHAEIIK